MAIRIGIVDFDSSHCVEFTRRINHLEIAEDQWVDGAPERGDIHVFQTHDASK